MGVDLEAAEATKVEHVHFSWWCWTPLWKYAELVALHESLDDVEGFDIAWEVGEANDGEFIDGISAKILGDRLLTALDKGYALLAKRLHDEAQATLPMEPCKFCDGSGIRSDAVGRTVGMDTQPLDDATAILLGRSHGFCNGCHGEGQALAAITSYRFDLEAIREFAEFAVDSNGFWIR